MYLLQHGAYPKTMEDALRYLQNYRGSAAASSNKSWLDEDGVMFMQAGRREKGPVRSKASRGTTFLA